MEDLQREKQKVEREIKVLRKKEMEETADFATRIQEIYDEFNSDVVPNQLGTAAEVAPSLAFEEKITDREAASKEARKFHDQRLKRLRELQQVYTAVSCPL